jgi:hypothetical protein
MVVGFLILQIKTYLIKLIHNQALKSYKNLYISNKYKEFQPSTEKIKKKKNLAWVH